MTSGNSRENEAQSSSSSGCRRNNQDSGQKIEEPPPPLSPLSPGTPVLFNGNNSEYTSAEDADIRTVRRMTRLRSRQQQRIAEESQSQECSGKERSARDKKMKRIGMSSSPKDANAQEPTMSSELPPEWSLPALTVVEVMDCPNFSVPGLERLLANAPQV